MSDITFSINFKFGKRKQECVEETEIPAEGLEKWLETAQQFVKSFRKKSR